MVVPWVEQDRVGGCGVSRAGWREEGGWRGTVQDRGEVGVSDAKALCLFLVRGRHGVGRAG